MPFGGLLEHNFILQQSVERARFAKRNICIAWLDVTNAFESFTSILTEEGVSPYIPISSGVKQGRPPGGLLFNIAIDPDIRRFKAQVLLTKFLPSQRTSASLPAHHMNSSSSERSSTSHRKAQPPSQPGKSFHTIFMGATPVEFYTEFFLGAKRLTLLMEVGEIQTRHGKEGDAQKSFFLPLPPVPHADCSVPEGGLCQEETWMLWTANCGGRVRHQLGRYGVQAAHLPPTKTHVSAKKKYETRYHLVYECKLWTDDRRKGFPKDFAVMTLKQLLHRKDFKKAITEI
ncbi:hypothetical protein CEXT_111191 [Caerostris extrusa]|uniref:Reverse transcriptase domain-containing protein n=1 Tax=Caerostris extrusa TaxID=172846 RepID=A0AAV4MV99_CAEEX|nr:hypothetical protein CEXT_111191 [Caerostris extrusa]